MRTFKALLVVFGEEYDLGDQLRAILARSDEPRFDINFQRGDDRFIHASARTLPIQVGSFAPALTFLRAAILSRPEVARLIQPGRTRRRQPTIQETRT